MKRSQQAVVAGLASVLVTLAFFFLVLKPKMNEVAQARTDLESAQEEEQSLRNDLRRLEEVKARAPESTSRLARISRLLPSSPELPGFIRTVQDQARLGGVELKSIAPSPPSDLEEATGIQTIAVTLQVSGGYFAISDFFRRLEELERVVEVTSLSLSPVLDPITGSLSLDGTITMQMYVVQADARLGASVGRRSDARSSASPSPSPSR